MVLTCVCAQETTQLSRQDTEIAIGDGKTMKAIAVLTMVFLPGTFIAVSLDLALMSSFIMSVC